MQALGIKRDNIVLEAAIETAELETENNPSSSLHYLLADLYQKLKTELPKDFKARIELGKLRRIGKEYLMDEKWTPKRVVESIRTDVTAAQYIASVIQNIPVANDYLIKHGHLAYQNMNNVLRTVFHFQEGRRQEDPEDRRLGNILLLQLRLDERFNFYFSPMSPVGPLHLL